MELTTYELLNPSDKIVFESPTLTVAVVAALLIGGGWYPLRVGDDVVFGAIAMYPNKDRESYFREHFDGKDVVQTMQFVSDEHLADLAAALSSFRLTSGGEPTSLNDICARAHMLGEGMVKNGGQ